MIKNIAVVVLLCCCGSGFAQKNFTTKKTANDKLKNIYDRAMRMASLSQWDDAIEDFNKALKTDPSFIDAQLQWANVKFQQSKFEEAKAGYERTIAIDSMYEPAVFYSLGLVEFDMKKFDEAAAHLDFYLKNAPKISAGRKTNAEHLIKNAKFSAKAFAHPVPFELKNLGPNINTAKHEYLPTLTADGETLIYCGETSSERYASQQDFFSSKLVDGKWQKGVPIDNLNTADNEGSQAISADGKLIVFTACDRQGGYGGCDLYYSETVNGKATPPKNMGPLINTKLLETQPSLSPDGRTLYFIRADSGWKGGSDIWKSLRQNDGKWGQPVKLDSIINSAEQEQSPFMHPDGKTLYFTSKGHVGMGGFDVFYARMKPDGTWGEPENLGYPINTAADEGAVFVSLDGRTAYISSTKEGGYGKSDIYSFDLYEAARPNPVTYVKATVVDAASQKPIAAKLEIVELETGKTFASAMTEADGEFLITLPAGGNYALNVSKEKYLFYSENFALDQPGTLDKPYKLNIALQPIGGSEGGASKPIVLKNVFFETGSAALRKESLVELARLKTLLDENPTLKIQINGHTDNVGADADNLKLSNNRAKAVYDYLTQNGIDASRLKFKGFGETAPAASNDTEEGRKLNRRTEYELIK